MKASFKRLSKRLWEFSVVTDDKVTFGSYVELPSVHIVPTEANVLQHFRATCKEWFIDVEPAAKFSLKKKKLIDKV